MIRVAHSNSGPLDFSVTSSCLLSKGHGKTTENFFLPNETQTHIWCVCNKNEIVVGARTGGQNKRVIIPVVGGGSMMGGEEI